MITKNFSFFIFFIFISTLCLSCNPAEDQTVITHTIVTKKKTINIYEDSIATSKVICKLNPGDTVFYPNKTSNGMASVALYEFGPQQGYIHQRDISSDTTIVTLSSVLRDKYGLKIVPELDEAFDSVANLYLDYFPIKKTNFWIYAIILSIGIAIFCIISDIEVPIGAQLLAFALSSPFTLWIAFNIQQFGLTQIDGFLCKLIILIAFLVLTVCMITALTASMGKILGHNFTFKSTMWSSLSVFLIYFTVAYIHSWADLFFKLGVGIYVAIILYNIIHIIIFLKNTNKSILITLCVSLAYIAVLLISIALINIIMIPMQVVSSILITQLIGAFMLIFAVVQFIAGVQFNSPNSSYSSWSIDNPQTDNLKYEHQIYGGLTRGSGFDNHWYDRDGGKYEEVVPGKFKKID